ncbi:MAG: TatD family hydrolase [Myxococcales bacterium]|nr:TatD family hydrolase [Myxococcales bacterium]
MFDTHCHFDDERFDDDRESAWKRAEEAGVGAAVIPAISPDRWDRTLSCTREGARFAALGVHPQCLPAIDDRAIRDGLDRIASLRREHAWRVVAVGEVGFDHTIDLALASPERQERVFAWHAEVARALELPLIVHVLRAHDAALRALSRVKLPSPAGVIHSYSGPAELVGAYEKLGFYLSFAGSVTRPKARRPIAAARVVSPERLLIETDAPDQTPTGVAPSVTRCEPAHLALVANALATALGEDEPSLRARTTRNARALFKVGTVL